MFLLSGLLLPLDDSSYFFLSIENDFFALIVISRSSEDPNVFLVNDFQDPLQVHSDKLYPSF